MIKNTIIDFDFDFYEIKVVNNADTDSCNYSQSPKITLDLKYFHMQCERSFLIIIFLYYLKLFILLYKVLLLKSPVIILIWTS